MKFLIEGRVTRGTARFFKMEVEAKSEKHARALVLMKIGGAEGTRKSQMELTKIEKQK